MFQMNNMDLMTRVPLWAVGFDGEAVVGDIYFGDSYLPTFTDYDTAVQYATSRNLGEQAIFKVDRKGRALRLLTQMSNTDVKHLGFGNLPDGKPSFIVHVEEATKAVRGWADCTFA